MNAPQKTIMNANLFSRLFDGLDDPTRLAIETIDGQRISYGDLITRAGQMANVLVSTRRQTGRSRRRANRKIGAGSRALSRDGARRRGLSAAQHRLHAERTRIFHHRRRAVAGGVRSRPRLRALAPLPRRSAPGSMTLGARRQGIADRGRRKSEAGIRDRRPRTTTTSPPSFTPPAPPAVPRARC